MSCQLNSWLALLGTSLAPCGRMANSTQENLVFNKRVLAIRSTDVAQFSSSDPVSPNQFVVQILNNWGVVTVGCNNVVNVDNSSGKQPAKNPLKKRCNRKGRKRQRWNRNNATSSSDEGRRETTLKELSFQIDSKTFQQALETFRCCANALRPLLLNGRWAEFERLAEEVLLKDDAVSPTCEIIVYLEKSVAFGFRTNELEQSEGMMNNAVKKIEQTSGSVRLLLEVLSKCYLASVYRRRKMFGKAERCLEDGWNIASRFPPCFPLACLLCELGTYKVSLVASSCLRRLNAKCSTADEGRKLLENCIELFSCLAECEEIYMYCQQVAISKIALMYLNCETSLSRNKDISKKNILEGEELLKILETEFDSSKESHLAKIQRLIVKVDLLYRREKYHDAEKIAQETLELIETLGFKIEVTRLQERLTDIRRKITECSKNETFRESVRIIASCSSTDNSAYSSEHAD